MAKLNPATLTGKQLRHLRALAHHLDPVVMLGKEGATESVIAAVSQALTDHELIKVRLPQIEKAERHTLATALATGSPAHLVGELGRMAILYRRHPNKPQVTLPRD